VVLLSEYEVGPPRIPTAQPDKKNVIDRIKEIKK
jgi:hypothetical protein